ncbi:DUF5133 domain-containing protein [Streptomyces sp. NPDC052225]|uniref:DUF5133 domain-containing protein n=1 Tax=Streptomyces sp. NPDC052225 TaxID=3154949 RepID=UPI0034198FD0
MLIPHPTVLRRLLAEYRQLSEGAAPGGAPVDAVTRQRLEDLGYTLCVVTGTRHISAALHTANRLLAGRAAGAEPVPE